MSLGGRATRCPTRKPQDVAGGSAFAYGIRPGSHHPGGLASGRDTPGSASSGGEGDRVGNIRGTCGCLRTGGTRGGHHRSAAYGDSGVDNGGRGRGTGRRRSDGGCRRTGGSSNRGRGRGSRRRKPGTHTGAGVGHVLTRGNDVVEPFPVTAVVGVSALVASVCNGLGAGIRPDIHVVAVIAEGGRETAVGSGVVAEICQSALLGGASRTTGNTTVLVEGVGRTLANIVFRTAGAYPLGTSHGVIGVGGRIVGIGLVAQKLAVCDTAGIDNIW